MSKTKGKNKSGATIAEKIIEGCKKMEEGVTESGIEIEKNLEKKFVRNFTSYFKKYFELITGYEFKYGSFWDEEFEKLEEDVVEKCKNYSIDDLCKWFKVEKWQDLFPKDYKQVDELKFKMEVSELIIEFFKNEVKKNSKYNKERLLCKECVLKLMYLDYYNIFPQIKEEELEKEFPSNDLVQEIKTKTSKKLKDEFLKENKLRILEGKHKEAEIIRKRIKEITDHQEENNDKELEEIKRLRFIEKLDPNTLELYDRCQMLYKKNKDVDIDNVDEFGKWVDKIRIELNKEEYERSWNEMFGREL